MMFDRHLTSYGSRELMVNSSGAGNLASMPEYASAKSVLAFGRTTSCAVHNIRLGILFAPFGTTNVVCRTEGERKAIATLVYHSLRAAHHHNCPVEPTWLGMSRTNYVAAPGLFGHGVIRMSQQAGVYLPLGLSGILLSNRRRRLTGPGSGRLLFGWAGGPGSRMDGLAIDPAHGQCRLDSVQGLLDIFN